MPTLRTIQQKELDHFKVDEDTGDLYWESRQVRTLMRLPHRLDIAAWVAAVGALLAGLAEVARLFGLGCA